MELLHLTNVLLLSVVLIVCFFIGRLIYYQIEVHLLKMPPGPLGLPILGYAPFISKTNMPQQLAHLNKKYGNVCSLTAATMRMVIVSDFDTAKELLCHPAVLFRPPQVFDFVPGKGGFATLNGKEWADERKFGMQAMRNIGLGGGPWNSIIQDDVAELVKHICSTEGKPMDIDTPLSHSAMRNMLALILGRQFRDGLSEESFMLFNESNKIFKNHFQNFGLALVFPWLTKYLIKFNIFGYGRKAKVLAACSKTIWNEILKRMTSDYGYDSSRDFVKQYFEEVKKQNPSLENISTHVERCLGNIALFISGSDTAMSSAHWILYFMAAYPDKQARVHAELDDVLGKNGLISWDDRNRLPYSMACLMEMERWVVVIPLFPPRCTTKTFAFHGYIIPEGTTVVANGWALNRDPKYWDKPDEYMPERFLQDNNGKLLKLDGYAPFSFGKRNCPGEKITLMISFLYFTGILQRFTVRTPSGDPPSLKLKYAGIFEPFPQPLCFIERE